MDRNRQRLDEILATLDDADAVAAIEAAWEEVEQQVAILARRGIRLTIGYDEEAGRFVVQDMSRIQH
jgi:hypothetical protein